MFQKHFEESQFEIGRADNWRKLIPNAIPTLFDTLNPSFVMDINKTTEKNQNTVVKTVENNENTTAEPNTIAEKDVSFCDTLQ